jgi:hypothetical protein
MPENHGTAGPAGLFPHPYERRRLAARQQIIH